MPRIRTLKPEHRQHRKVGPLDHVTYRLWVGMILEADDEGRLVCELPQLRATIFPYRPEVEVLGIDKALRMLTRLGLIQRYFARGTWYASFRSWTDHQRIDHPTRSKLPAPPVIKATITEAIRRAVAQRYYELAGVPTAVALAPLAVDCHHCHLSGGQIGWVLDRPSFVKLELDHLIPESQGGETIAENIVLACRKCNRSRTKKSREPSRIFANVPGGSEGIGRDQGKDQGSEGGEREGRNSATPDDRVVSSNNPNGRGPTYRRPGRGDFAETLREITARHPELSEAEREARALRVYHGGLTT